MINNILKMPRFLKRLAVICADVIGLVGALILANFILTFEGIEYYVNWYEILLEILSFILLAYFFGFYKHIFRYTILESNGKLIALFFIYYSVINVVDIIFGKHFSFLNNFLVIVIYMAIYLLTRYIAYWLINKKIVSRNKINIAIYGLDEDSFRVIGIIKQLGGIHVSAIFDDDEKRIGATLHGAEIHSSISLSNIISKFNISYILINEKKKIAINHHVRELHQLKVPIKALPSLSDIMSQGISLKNLEDYGIEELLYRDKADFTQRVINEKLIVDKVVLITGGGGSVGGEIAKQITLFKPGKVIILDHSEFNLYKIKNELSGFNWDKLVTVLGSYSNTSLINELVKEYKPTIIFHAAAYKHVPLLEENIIECIENNFIGTIKFIAAIAGRGVTHFSYISSDKAVRPTNIMGASKRLCEKYIQSIAAKDVNTKFTIVRFGNVLNSSGSVVPQFKSQIKNGGPITVTHPEITRYFMTLSEAVYLVIRATEISKSGEISLLDMGSPIKILDLAKKMIELSGFNPVIATDKDVNLMDRSSHDLPIIFTGLRSGEKLYEELLIEEDSTSTICPKIFTASERYEDGDEMQKFIIDIEQLISLRNIKKILQKTEKFTEANFGIAHFKDL